MGEPEPVLTATGLTKRFGALTACNAVDLTVRAGEIHALIGPNGAGKSTLIKLLTGEERCDAGNVTLCGRDLTPLSAPRRTAAGLARSFQVSALALELTAQQNVMLALTGRDGATFQFFSSAMRTSALTQEAQVHLETAGLGTRAATPAGALAHGERRLLEVALALALRPRVFLFDEPMAGLGDTGSRALTDLLSGLRDEAPILLIEHDMKAVFALADRISVLVYGEIIATGTPAQIRQNDAVRAAYLGTASTQTLETAQGSGQDHPHGTATPYIDASGIGTPAGVP